MENETNPSLFDAVSSAIDGNGTSEPAPEEIEQEVEQEIEETGDEAEPQEESSDEAPDDDATDEEADEKGYARDPVTGKFVKKPEPEAEPKAKEPAAKERKVVDPVNDPIPKDLKQETQQRIRTLIETTKTITADRDKIKADFDYIVQGLQATGTTPEQYRETLSWLSMFNSNDPAQQRKALELVETVAERLSLVLGVDRQASDPLSTHADLKDAVAKGQITAQYAREIARNRNAQSFRGEIVSASTQQQQAELQRQQELNNGRLALNNLEAQLKASDPHYNEKSAALIPILQPLFQKIPPSQWEAEFRNAYAKMKTPTAAKSAVPKNQPLRANKNPAGGGTKGVNSMLDAVNGALAGLQK